MRQIEEKMVEAIKQEKNFSLSNTTVKVSDGLLSVYLFGNCIYARSLASGIAQFSLCGYNTVTTRSRLNAIGLNITTRRGQVYYNGQPISEYGNIYV